MSKDSPSIDLFGSLRINSFYKYFLYLFGIVFLLSLIIDVQGINVTLLRSISVNIVLICIVVWFLEESLGWIGDYLDHKSKTDRLSRSDAEGYAKGFITFMIFVHLIAIILIGTQLFRLGAQ